MSETMFGRIERGRLPASQSLSWQSPRLRLGFGSMVARTRTATRCATRRTPGCSSASGTSCLPELHWRPEVPLPIAGDRRAWDAQCVLDRTRGRDRGEMRLFDLQALDRRIALKRRDGGLDHRRPARRGHSRQSTAPGRAPGSASAELPARLAAVLAAVRLGRSRSSGIVVLYCRVSSRLGDRPSASGAAATDPTTDAPSAASGAATDPPGTSRGGPHPASRPGQDDRASGRHPSGARRPTRPARTGTRRRRSGSV